MTLERNDGVIMRHAVPVVSDANHALAAGFHLDANRFCARVNSVFEKLFDDGGRAFDNFARGDFVRDGFREYADAAHFLAGSSLTAMFNWSSWSVSTSEGDSAIKSWALVVFGKATTSRRDFSPARSMTTRSMPRAMPPWGGVP